MTQRISLLVIRLLSIIAGFLAEFLRFGQGLLRPRASLVAENLFLKKQLAFYLERNVAPRRLTDKAKRFAASLVSLVRLEECSYGRKA